jgi:hypothetical protein
MASQLSRIAVIGDVGGHLVPLRSELIALGADRATLRLPADLTVVQVGDLVHRGPDSEGVVALVDHLLAAQPSQWVQLAGNHEAQYLNEPRFEWPETIAPVAAEALRTWWSSGAMRAAAAVSTPREDFLITHAGLTEGYWRQALDAPSAAQDAARAINSFIDRHQDVLFHAGCMLGGAPDFTAGPLWASAASELVPSWLRAGTPMPFSQVHGHSRVVDWRRKELRCDDAVAAVTTADLAAAHAVAAVPGGRIVGVDPGHGRKPHRPWAAFVIEGQILQP